MKTITRTMYLSLMIALITTVNIYGQQALYDVTPGNGNGVRFWQHDAFKIHMGNTGEYLYGPVDSYSIKMNMSSDGGRGWTWGVNGQTPVAALSNTGNLQLYGGFFAMTGNVGVGTNSVFNTSGWNRVLDVRGTNHAKVLATAVNAAYAVGVFAHSTWYGGGGFVGTETNHDLHLIASADSKVIVKTSGSVGVGTVTPRGKFDIDGPGDIYLTDDVNAGAAQSIFLPGHIYLAPYNGSNISYLQARRLDNSGSTALQFRTYNEGLLVEALRINSSGNVGIGTTNPDQKLTVKGIIHSEEVRVDLSVPGPDYVFEPDYNLQPLSEVESFIKENKHLPEVPSAKEMETKGIEVGEMNMILLKKVEELTLYVIELKKEIEVLRAQR